MFGLFLETIPLREDIFQVNFMQLNNFSWVNQDNLNCTKEEMMKVCLKYLKLRTFFMNDEFRFLKIISLLNFR